MSLWWRDVSAMVEAGGPVMLPLIGVGVLVNFLLAMRFLTLLRLGRSLRKEAHVISSRSETSAPSSNLASQRGMGWESRLIVVEAILRRESTLINALITAAPLLGLLGTVSGMILTFDGLADMSMFGKGGGIAGGISEALLTTQLGLGIAMPALLCQRLLDRWNRRWLEQVQQWLGQSQKTLGASR